MIYAYKKVIDLLGDVKNDDDQQAYVRVVLQILPMRTK